MGKYMLKLWEECNKVKSFGTGKFLAEIDGESLITH